MDIYDALLGKKVTGVRRREHSLSLLTEDGTQIDISPSYDNIAGRDYLVVNITDDEWRHAEEDSS